MSLVDKVIVITGASDGIGAELAGTGVDVTVVFPGVVATNIRYHGYGADGKVAGRSGLKEEGAMSVEECARRDVNGLYAKAFAGEIKGFTGVDDPYEAPLSPEVVVDTETTEPEEAAAAVVARLEELGLIGAEVAV